MGAFIVRHLDLDRGAELARYVLSNVLAYEGTEAVLRQLFPPYQSALTFQLGVSGPTLRSRDARPNAQLDFVPFGPQLTFLQCTDASANEGGCYSDAMRASFGYSRKTVTFAAAREADGGAFGSNEVTFPNLHAWAPQNAADWDLPWTTEIEQPPPAWTPQESWESEVGFPWQRPRKRLGTNCDPDHPGVCLYPYMRTWDPSGALDWLTDLRKMGGFPLTVAFLADSNRRKLIAAALFAGAVLLRPGTALYIRYQARIFGRITRDFAHRFARYAFGRTGNRYDALYCRPLLATAPVFTRRTTYGDVAPFFDSPFAAVALDAWSYVAGPPPRIQSIVAPQWYNSSGAIRGPFGGLAVYGTIGGVNELMWITPIDPPLSVPPGDTLRVPNRVQFQLEGV